MTTTHSSLKPSTRVEQYVGDQCKYYYLPLFEKTLLPPVLEELFGAANYENRSLDGVTASLVKAKKGHYSHVKIPLDRFSSPAIEKVLKEAAQFDLGVVLQVCTSFLYDESFFNKLKMMPEDCEIEWVLDSCHYHVESRILELTPRFKNSHLSVGVHKKLDWVGILKTPIMRVFPRVHLYFGYQLQPSTHFLNCKQSHKIVGLLNKNFPGIEFLPPKGVDLWDHRARPDFDMEPYIKPCYVTRSIKPNVKYSVVIPTFNNQNHIRVVLKHLFCQSVGADNFEIIVVDDGGTDSTQERLIEMINNLNEPINFKYIFFPRARNRVMGDSQYRAGISRNLGVKNAEGEILCFLDSDIVVPSDYLESVGEGLMHWDALQARRVNLCQEASVETLEYNDVDESKDTILDEAYWEEFIKIDNWHELPYNWKYVCTHSFSMRRDLFWKIGGLKRNFIFYGFEDTDLGYRLVKRGFKLHLLDRKVYHLFHENTRSEFLNLKSLRHSLLSRTAQIFYLHHLDEDIYENLLGFMEPEPTFQRLFGRVIETVSLQFLWRATPPVYKTMKKVRWKNL